MSFPYVNFTDIYFRFKISIIAGYQLTIFQLAKLRKMTGKYFIVTPKYFHNKKSVLGSSGGVILLVNLHLVKLQEESADLSQATGVMQIRPASLSINYVDHPSLSPLRWLLSEPGVQLALSWNIEQCAHVDVQILNVYW